MPFGAVQEDNFRAIGGKTPQYWLDVWDQQIANLDKDKLDSVVVLLGVNEVNNTDSMKVLIDKLAEKFSGKPIYIQKLFPVGEAYSSAWITRDDMIKAIINFNNVIQEYCNTKEGVYFIDTTEGYVNSNGFLESSYTNDGLHLTDNNKWVQNIIEKISAGSDPSDKLKSRYVINCKSNVTIKGAGQSETILKPVAVDNLLNNALADTLPIDMFHYNGIYVDPNPQTLQNANFMDFTIDSSEATSSGEYNALGKGFNIEYCENCNFDHILIQNTEGTGFGINFPINSTISNCIALGCGRKATIQNAGAEGFGIGIGYSNNESLTITNCESIGNRRCGYAFEDQNLWHPELCKATSSNGFKIINSKAKNNLYDFGGRRSYNVTLTGCVANDDTVSINSNPLNSQNEKAFAYMTDSRNIKFENTHANIKYSDLTDTQHYAYEPTYWALDNGIIDGGLTSISGQNVTEAQVTSPVNRAQAILMLHRFAGRPGDLVQGDASFVTNTRFNDVPGENNAYTYCADAVLWADDNGIVSKSDALFRPADGCTRSEFLIMLYKYKNNMTISNNDVPYEDAFAWASKNGIINTNQQFNPGSVITRGDLLTMLYRCLNPFEVDPEPTEPSQPSQSFEITGLKAVVNGSDVDVSWNPIAPEAVGNASISYDIYLDEPGLFYLPERKPDKSTNSNNVKLPLNNMGQYTVTVRPYYYSNDGQKNIGEGASINFVYDKKNDNTPSQQPPQVTGLKANINGTNVEITWDPIMQSQVVGQDKLCYDVYLYEPGMVYIPERSPSRTTSSNNVTLSLNSYGDYSVTVIPYYLSSNSQKITGSASSIDFTYSEQAAQVPGLPNIQQDLGLQKVNLKLGTKTGNIQTITWNSIPSATAYDYVIKKDDLIIYEGRTTNTTLDYPMNESGKYTAYVRAYTSSSTSDWSEPLDFEYNASTDIKPNKVNLTVDPQRLNYIPIKWAPVEGATGYELYVTDNNRSNTSQVIGTSANLTINTNSIYTIKVRACNDTYKGEWSDSYEIKSKNYRQKPGKVNVTIDPQKSNYIPIRWAPVEGATEYELNVTTDKNKDTTMKVSGTGTNFIIDTNTIYTIKVRAINDTYKGEWSDTHTFKSKNYIPKPSKVTNLQVTSFPSSNNGYKVTLQWDKAPDATSYDVLVSTHYYETTMENVKLSYQGNKVSTVISVDPTDTFAFKVRAVNASGEGAYSYQVSAPIAN